MRIVHICLAAMLMTGAVSCQKQTTAESASLEVPKPAPALPEQAGAKKSPKFGISTPNASVHEYSLAPGKPLDLNGWVIADEQVDFGYELNGVREKARPNTRKDIQQHYSSYKFKQGWVITVPADKLKPENTLRLFVANNCVWTMTVSLK